MKATLGHAPFLRIVIFVMAGILFQSMLNIHVYVCLAFSLVCVIANFLAFINIPHQLLFKFRFQLSISIFILLFSIGMSLFAIQDIKIHQKYFAHYINENSQSNYFDVLISNDLIKTKNGVKTSADIIRIQKDSIQLEVIGKINLFFEDTATFSKIQFGDIISIHTKIAKISAVKNPNEFDIKAYNELKNISYQAFINKKHFTIKAHHQTGLLKYYIYTIRQFISRKFEQHIHEEQAIGVCKALILGIEEDLDASLLKAYASCGVIHVLSVSGLHVGIFYIIINYLFSFIKIDHEKIHWFKALISLLLIWFYALLSGFSPSVLRSAVMLSTIIIANTIDRKISIYNSLASSFFILLCFHAKYIFDVGFQLSYIAILGIVYIQPKLYQLYVFRNYLLDKIWNMTTVSISAQFTTFPLSVYYFYQFPLLFLFTNLLVIPILSLTLPLGFIFMFFCLFNADFILHYLAMPIEWSILISNKIIVFFDKIPFNTLCPVYFTQLQLIFVYVIIGVFFIVLELKNSKWVLVFQALLIGLFAYFIFEKINQSYQEKLVVFNIQNAQRIEFIQGNNSFIYTNKIDTAMYMFKIRPFHIFNRVNLLSYINSKEKNYEIHWKNKYIAIINNPIENNMNLKKYHYIIVGNNALNPIFFSNTIDSNQVWIFDSSNSLKYIESIAKMTNFHYHATKTDKAYILNL